MDVRSISKYMLLLIIFSVFYLTFFFIFKEYKEIYGAGLAFLILLTFFSFLKPYWSLLICIGSIPLYHYLKIEVGIPTFTIYDVLVMILFLVFVFNLLLHRIHFKLYVFDYFVILWALINILSLFHNLYDPVPTLNDFRYRFAIPIALYFLIRAYINDYQKLNNFLWIQLLSISVMAFFGIIEFIQTGERIKTLIQATLASSLFFSWGILLSYYFWKNPDVFKARFLAIICFMINSLALIFTFPRVIFFSLIVISLFFKMGLLRIKKEILIIFLLIFSTILPFMIVHISNIFLKFPQKEVLYKTIYPNNVNSDQRMIEKHPKRLIEKKSYIKSIIGRALNWSVMIEYFKKHFLLGFGYSIFIFLRVNNLITLSHAHNISLDILLRVGIIGLFIFVMIFVSYIRIWQNSYNIPKMEIYNIFLNICLFELLLILLNGLTNNIVNIFMCSLLWSVLGISICFIEFLQFKNKCIILQED